MPENSNAVNVKIHALLKVRQDGAKEQFLTIENGQLFRKDANIYIRYQEKIQIDDLLHPTSVTVKITENNQAEIVRSGASRMKLRFILKEEVPSSLQSGQGAMSLTTKTYACIHEVLGENYGKLRLDYELYSLGQKLGEYEFHLTYS